MPTYAYFPGNLMGNIFTNAYIGSAFIPVTFGSIWIISRGRKTLLYSGYFGGVTMAFILAILVRYEHLPGLLMQHPVIINSDLIYFTFQV